MTKTRQECGRLGGLIGRKSAIQYGKECEQKYDLSPKFCKKCGKVLDYNHRNNDFCNRSCAASYNNNLKLSPDRDITKQVCAWCKKPISGWGNIYCKNSSCRMMHAVSKFLNSESNVTPKPSTVRKYYIYLRGHKCEKCMNTEWINQPIPLELHHKDGNCKNNSPENVELLCRNCHAFTDTFGRKNKKSTRKRIYTLV